MLAGEWMVGRSPYRHSPVTMNRTGREVKSRVTTGDEGERRYDPQMLLAADMGGTKTLVGLFRRGEDRPEAAVVREYATLDFDSLDEIIGAFLDETGGAGVEAACVGAAGQVSGLMARLTNVPWMADASPVAQRLGYCPIELLNDLEAMAHAIPVLQDEELAALQEGIAVPGGNAALIAAGTGLGEALLHNVDGRFVPAASEGGHADFAARTARELALVEELTLIHGRVDVERVVSGRGLTNLFRFTHGTQDLGAACRVVGPNLDPVDVPAAVTASALAGACEQCAEALDMFVEAYGAEAGNLALRSMATAGVYIGGGIAPKILPALVAGGFMEAFVGKEPMVDWLRMLPVTVILNPGAGLLGAAVRASEL
jgi:glucokinase